MAPVGSAYGCFQVTKDRYGWLLLAAVAADRGAKLSSDRLEAWGGCAHSTIYDELSMRRYYEESPNEPMRTVVSAVLIGSRLKLFPVGPLRRYAVAVVPADYLPGRGRGGGGESLTTRKGGGGGGGGDAGLEPSEPLDSTVYIEHAPSN